MRGNRRPDRGCNRRLRRVVGLVVEGTVSVRGLYRPRRNRVVAGVAAGLAQRFGWPVWLMRLVWVLLLLPGGLPGVVPYVVLWVVMPSEP
jgi:phage shock protein PspC (stress-responsive transcriptional regulator)